MHLLSPPSLVLQSSSSLLPDVCGIITERARDALMSALLTDPYFEAEADGGEEEGKRERRKEGKKEGQNHHQDINLGLYYIRPPRRGEERREGGEKRVTFGIQPPIS